MSRSKGKGHKPRGTFGTGHSTPIYEELQESPAYQVLTSAQRCVLVDMLRQYSRASSWDTTAIPDGFQYTFGHCREPVSEVTFLNAVNRFREVGFFRVPPDIQEFRPAAPRRFVPSSDWRTFKPPKSQQAKMFAQSEKKKSRLENKRKRRTDFRVSVGKSKNGKSPKELGRQEP